MKHLSIVNVFVTIFNSYVISKDLKCVSTNDWCEQLILMLVTIKLLLWSGLIWPEGRRMGVPETTTDDARPWYPTGSLNLQNRTASQHHSDHTAKQHFYSFLSLLCFFLSLLAVKYSSAMTNCAFKGEQVVCSGFTENNLC